MVIDFREEPPSFQELHDFGPGLAGGKGCHRLNNSLIDAGNFKTLRIE